MVHPVCKKCSFNKPPRTHHCGWCNVCVLKYDHHCPWLNNCIGFYNHRYFYQFCCFMAMGCLYAGSFGYREYQMGRFGLQLFDFTDSFHMASDIFYTLGVAGFITYYIFVMAFVTGWLLIGLSCWHGRLISRDETSVERLINENPNPRYQKEGFRFVIENWKRFLGVRNMREFTRRILLPSTHKPRGDGMTMDNYDNNKYPSKFPSWERQSNSDYPPQISSKQRTSDVQEC